MEQHRLNETTTNIINNYEEIKSSNNNGEIESSNVSSSIYSSGTSTYLSEEEEAGAHTDGLLSLCAMSTTDKKEVMKELEKLTRKNLIKKIEDIHRYLQDYEESLLAAAIEQGKAGVDKDRVPPRGAYYGNATTLFDNKIRVYIREMDAFASTLLKCTTENHH